ncbi:polyhydroxyalkanoic acid system protein (plasmid) [Acidovorax sp. 210-6]|jgi:hypothetical protein|uniref:polyhydroxyalkanoic acid system family protein n=1 Tax=Acidovorax sp. 210-6 TaxID=2699468 RepID=UPI001389CD8B|nr:polyhydroxyalkanoic acid system family protein [Acidovorax sp. 210-6]NCU68006.1 polyhydroxyalkanoic acid system protein [Acidovorax sp. 210-6]
MTSPITITIPHQLGRAEARRRIDEGFARMLQQLPGISGAGGQQWEGDRLRFNLATMGQSVGGVVDVGDTTVTLELTLPGLLGVIANGLKGRLQEKVGQLLLPRK